MPASLSAEVASEWPRLAPRLLLYAGKLHRHALARFPHAPDPHDLVHDAVADLLSGHRTRPEDVTLFVFLCGVVRSKASNFLMRQQRLDGTDRLGRYVDADGIQARRIPTPGPEGEGVLRDQVRALVADDAMLAQMVELLFEDPELRPADLADLLGCSAHDVYSARKRLERRVAALRPIPAD